MSSQDWKQENEQTRRAWDANAEFWDERMADGNSFMNYLIWPATERLLAIQPGERVLDIACGNGVSTRKIAALGADVLAFDFSANMIEQARQRGVPEGSKIDYRIVDATNEAALRELGQPGSFDAAICNMALFDMAVIQPLLNTLAVLLKSGGRFVFSIIHPCFNNPYMFPMAEQHEMEGKVWVEYSVRVTRYMTAGTARALGMRYQPEVQLVFHRPLQETLGACFQAGFVMDGMEERAFPPEVEGGSFPLSWNGHFSEIPPVLVARMRIPDLKS